jgi:uncharacterized protein YbjT (DUF2867 family)
MRVVVTGGSGLIGPKLVTKLLEHRHDVIAPSREPAVGADTLRHPSGAGHEHR